MTIMSGNWLEGLEISLVNFEMLLWIAKHNRLRSINIIFKEWVPCYAESRYNICMYHIHFIY